MEFSISVFLINKIPDLIVFDHESGCYGVASTSMSCMAVSRDYIFLYIKLNLQVINFLVLVYLYNVSNSSHNYYIFQHDNSDSPQNV